MLVVSPLSGFFPRNQFILYMAPGDELLRICRDLPGRMKKHRISGITANTPSLFTGLSDNPGNRFEYRVVESLTDLFAVIEFSHPGIRVIEFSSSWFSNDPDLTAAFAAHCHEQAMKTGSILLLARDGDIVPEVIEEQAHRCIVFMPVNENGDEMFFSSRFPGIEQDRVKHGKINGEISSGTGEDSGTGTVSVDQKIRYPG
jgi:hypothetical protein